MSCEFLIVRDKLGAEWRRILISKETEQLQELSAS